MDRQTCSAGYVTGGGPTLRTMANEAGREDWAVRAARARVPRATVITADAQTADLLAAAPGTPFDRVVSRLRVMFFEDPTAAFANLRSVTARGGRLAFACWRAGDADQIWHGFESLAARMDSRPLPPAVGEPGPLGLADRGRTRTILTDAGWSDVALEPLDADLDYAIDGSDGVEERLTVFLASRVGEAVRRDLEPRLGPAGWQAALEEARAGLRAAAVDGRVLVPSRAWLVTAVKA